MDLVLTALLFLVLLLSVHVGWFARSRMQERHVSKETVESIRLLMGMLLTFSALVLGLLTSSAKQRFDGYNIDLNTYAADLIQLDHRLRVYGPEAAPIRAQLRTYTAAAIADSWPNEPAPSGTYPRFANRTGPRIETIPLGDMLADIDTMIGRLESPDPARRLVAGRLRDRVAQAVQQRWKIIFSTRTTLSWPFLLILTTWLAIVFGIFGLTSPRNRLVNVVVLLSALSIASPLYLILEYGDALRGLAQLSSSPMRAALGHMDEP